MSHKTCTPGLMNNGSFGVVWFQSHFVRGALEVGKVDEIGVACGAGWEGGSGLRGFVLKAGEVEGSGVEGMLGSSGGLRELSVDVEAIERIRLGGWGKRLWLFGKSRGSALEAQGSALQAGEVGTIAKFWQVSGTSAMKLVAVEALFIIIFTDAC